MRDNFAASLSRVLKHEGGYVNHPDDPGGATNKGITIATYRRYIKPNGTVQDLKNISDVEVASVYRKQYWDAVKGDDLPSGVDYAVFDFAVNSGPSRAAKFLQRVIGVEDDGAIGPATLKAVRALSAPMVIREMCNDRLAWLETLRHWPTFKNGWTSRVNSVLSDAVKMASSQSISKPIGPAPKPSAKPEKQTLCSWFRSLRKTP